MTIKTVLIIDEDDDERNRTIHALQAAGFKVLSASNGLDGYHLALSKEPDVVLMEVEMAEVSGLQVSKSLRRNTLTASLPIVMLGSSNDSDIIKQCAQIGLKEYITKPVDISQLIQRLHLVIEQHNELEPVNTEDSQMVAASIIDELSTRLRKENLEFTSLPQLGQKIIEQLEDDKSSIGAVARLLEKEAGMAAKIIKASNTVHFVASKPCIHPKEAIVRIGVKRTLSYLLIVSTLQLFKTDLPLFNKVMQKIILHSITTAIIAREVARLSNSTDLDRVFSIAMFHDIGKLILLKILHDISDIRPINNEMVLDNVLKKLHTRFGSSILKRWKFPLPFIDSAAQHHDKPDRHKHSKSSLIIILSNELADIIDDDYISNLSQFQNHPCVSLLKIKLGGLSGLPDKVENELSLIDTFLAD